MRRRRWDGIRLDMDSDVGATCKSTDGGALLYLATRWRLVIRALEVGVLYGVTM
jgi:hypothetical protein